MNETFTTTTITNAFEMKDQGGIENMGTDESDFYNSIRIDLDLLERGPKVSTIQNILNLSKNYAG